ncbi:transporter substrate-binding domain-containing protein [Legionella sp. km772]|uniref:transporter substrate-binding domain-containing protein n=1 Tax=Legionella sp. km772 TaxID=2498111 RepID=UPI000F8CC26D|nr:transporter substrate-binding domain-containing protein [Legionella sp. km772]RUR08649.1 transporter substrate-binding domain-containing protein [Legionella sp. km772]
MSSLRKYLFFFCLCFLLPHAYATKLVIGTLSYDSPFSNTKENVFADFEIMMMKEICKRIHSECVFETVLFHDIPQKMSKGTIDLALGSIIITEEKRKNFLFSLPYQDSHLQYVALKKSSLNTIQQLTGKTIGVSFRCPTRNLALKHIDNTIQVNELPTNMNMLKALEKQKISAVLTHYHHAIQWANKRKFKLLGPKFRIGEGYGIMTQLHQTNLINQINEALLGMENDGTYIKLYKEYL